MTIVLTTNNLTQAEALCTHVAVLNRASSSQAGLSAKSARRRPAPAKIIGGFTDEVVALLPAAQRSQPSTG